MSDHDDPTAERPSGGGGTADEPTSVMRTPADEPTAAVRTPADQPPRAVRATTTETVRAERMPPAGVSTGAAVAGAIAALLIGLLLGFLLFDSDDDDSGTATTDTATDDGEAAALRAERDELMGVIAERDGQIEELEADLDERTAERDALQAQADEAGDEPATIPAPDVVGGSADDARGVAGDNGWTLVEREAGDAPDDAEPGTVVDQSPEPGTPMTEGSVLVIDVVQEPEGQ